MAYLTEVLYGDTAQVQHGSRDLFGSGRLIGRNLVLTARHILIPDRATEPIKDGWQVRLVGDSSDLSQWRWIEASMAWTGTAILDLALLQLHSQPGALDYCPALKLRIGRIDQVHHHRVRGVGFPRGAKVNKKRTLFVPSGDLDDEKGETLSFGIDSAYQPESPAEDWRGFSGASILLEESHDSQIVWIYGVAQQVGQAFSRRIDVARLAEAWEDKGFRDVLKAARISLHRPVDPLGNHRSKPRKGEAQPPSTGRIQPIQLKDLEAALHTKPNRLVLIIFYAAWSAPCRHLLSTLDQFANGYAEKVRVYKVEVTDDLTIQSQLGITLLPTVFIYLNGTILDRLLGKRSITEFQAIVDRHLARIS